MEASQGPGADIWREEEDEAGGNHHSRATGPGYDEHAEEYAASASASARKGVIKDPKSPLLGRRMSPESRVRFSDSGVPPLESDSDLGHGPPSSAAEADAAGGEMESGGGAEMGGKDDVGELPKTAASRHSGRETAMTAASGADTHTANASPTRNGTPWNSLDLGLQEGDSSGNRPQSSFFAPEAQGEVDGQKQKQEHGEGGGVGSDAGHSSARSGHSSARSEESTGGGVRLGASSLIKFNLDDFFRAKEARRGKLPQYNHDRSLLRRRPATSSGVVAAADGGRDGGEGGKNDRPESRDSGRPSTAASHSSLKSAVSDILLVSKDRIARMMDGSDIASLKTAVAVETKVEKRVASVPVPTGRERIAALRKLLNPSAKGATWDDMILKGGGGGDEAIEAIREYLWVEEPDPNAFLGATLRGKVEAVKVEVPTIWWNVSLADAVLESSGVKRVCDSLWECTTLTSLDISNNVAIPTYLEGLAEAEPAGLDLAYALCPYVMRVTSLTSLSIAGNWLREEGARLLAPILSTNSLLTSLNLGGNNLFKEGLRELRHPLTNSCTHLEYLNLNANWIGPLACRDLSDILFANPALRTLDMRQNAIGSDGTMTLCPNFRLLGSQLVSLEMLDNNLDEQSQRNLFPAVLDMMCLTHLGGLSFGVVGGFFDYVIANRVGSGTDVDVASIVDLDLSHAKMPEFPRVLLGLTGLQRLDVSGNSFPKLPWINLCLMTNLTSLGCAECERLKCPPPEITSRGGEVVMEYLREMHKDGRFQTQMVLIMVGEAESGKSTLLKAFQALSAPPKEQEEISSPQSVKGGNGKDGGGNGTSAAAAPAAAPAAATAAAAAAGGGADGDDGKAVAGDEGVRAADGTYVPTVGVVMHKWVPKGEDRRLSFLTLDMGGSMHYSVVHEFFMTRGTYLLTFRALDETYDEKEKSAHHVNSVKRWVSALNLCAPNSNVLLVMTHKDVVDPSEAERQCSIISTALAQERREGRCSFQLLCGARIFQVAASRGVEGVSGLLRTLCDEVKENESWSEPLTSEFVAVRDRLDEVRFRDKLVDIKYEEFVDIVLSCGVQDGEELQAVTRRLHECLEIRYYGGGEAVMEGRVFLDVLWCSGAFRGLIRMDRVPLIRFFEGGFKGATQDLQKLAWTKRIYFHGYINKGAIKFLWPSQPVSQDYWNAVWKGKLGPEEAEIWNTRIALHDEDYKPIVRMLTAYGILSSVAVGASAGDELYCPFLGSALEKMNMDTRGFVPLEETPLQASFCYSSLPQGFFKRLSVRLASHAHHSDLSVDHTIVYSLQGRCRASIVNTAAFDEMNQAAAEKQGKGVGKQVVDERRRSHVIHDMGRTIVIDATCRMLFELAIQELSGIERFYPGLERESSDEPSKEVLDEWESSRRPPDVLISHSSKSKSKEYATSVEERLRELFPDILILKSSDALSGERRFLSSEVRVFVVVLDAAYQKSERCKAELQDAYEQGCHIIPILTQSYQFPASADEADESVYTKWYGDIKALSGRWRMYIDMRMLRESEAVKTAEDELENYILSAEASGEKATETALNTKNQAVELAKQVVSDAQSLRITKMVGGQVGAALRGWRCPPIPNAHSDEEEEVEEIVEKEEGAVGGGGGGGGGGEACDVQGEQGDAGVKVGAESDAPAPSPGQDAGLGVGLAVDASAVATDDAVPDAVESADAQTAPAPAAPEGADASAAAADAPSQEDGAARAAAQPHPHMDFAISEINIPCQDCLAALDPRPCVFERRALKKELEAYMNEELVRLGKGERPFSEPMVTCFNGHAHPLSTVLAGSHGWEGIPCPSCVRRGQRQPFCFSSPKLLTFFEGVALEESDVRDESAASTNHAAGASVAAAVQEKEKEEGEEGGEGGEEAEGETLEIVPGYKTMLKVECPDCTSALGISTKFSVHELIHAKVFISFHWGVAMGEHFSGPFSGHTRARSVRDMLRKELDVYTYIDTIGPNDEDPGVHARQTVAAIKACNVFIVFLCDAYINSSRCRREFGSAAGSSKYIIPVLLPTEFDVDGDELVTIDGSTGWTSHDLSADWWRHATKISKAKADKAPQWQVLQYFNPVSLVENPTKYDGDRTTEHTMADIARTVMSQMYAGEHVKHAIKRTYSNWKGASGTFFAQLRTQTEGEEGLDLTVYQRAQARAVQLFKMIDTDGSGVIEREELAVGLARLGFNADDGAINKMISEADVDGNVGIDQEEFVSVIMRITVEETGSISNPDKGRA